MSSSTGIYCSLSFFLIEETDYDYSGSEEEDDELNEDEGEPRLILWHEYKIWLAKLFSLKTALLRQIDFLNFL